MPLTPSCIEDWTGYIHNTCVYVNLYAWDYMQHSAHMATINNERWTVGSFWMAEKPIRGAILNAFREKDDSCMEG